MDASELGRWTRFAAKGGIGKCTALQDCIAEQAEDLMFMKDDEIIVLMQIPGQSDLYLGYCEGVVGHFRGDAVRFHGRLKKPVLTKRQSAVSPIARPSSSQSAITVAARDNPSPAISTSLSFGSISAVPFSPTTPPPQERSSSHTSSLATAMSSAPITPADDRHDSPTVAQDAEQSSVPTSPIHLGEIAKQLVTDSPVDPRFDSFDRSTSRFPPLHRDSSVYDDSESSTRISVALSDGGVGIGLSLLQDFAGGGGDEGDDDDDDDMSIRRTASPESTVEGPPGIARADSQYSQSPRSVAQPPLSARSEASFASLQQPPASAQSDSHYSDSPQSSAAPLPSTHSGSDYGGDDWEGADDIYDDYRYSRYSMASKMSRFSKGSMYTVASTSEVVPPIPTEHTRPSLDSNQRDGLPSPRELKGSKEAGPSKLSESATSEELLLSAGESVEERLSKLQKNRPAPLTFKKEPTPSPLLHATFGSPQASPTAPTATTSSFASPTLVSPVYPTHTGAATNLRMRLEKEREMEDSSDAEGSHKARSSQDIVMEDREDIPMTAVSQAAEIVQEHAAEAGRSPPPTPAVPPTASQPESSAQAEKRMIANAEPSPDQPPPPPYSLTAPSTSQRQSPTPSSSPPAPSTTLPVHPQARPIDPNRIQADPQARQSLFMPHPGAPKPTSSSAGPMYGRQPVPHLPSVPTGPPPGSVQYALQCIVSARREGRPAPPTIYGRLEYDLAASIGPVPVSFGLEPQNNVPANRPARPPVQWTAPPPSRTGTPASQASTSVDLSGRRSADPAGRKNAMLPPLQGAAGLLTQPIARANFTPSVHTARPRSRSFSGFASGTQEDRMQALARGSREEGSTPVESVKPLQIMTKRSKSAMATTTEAAHVPAPQRATVSHSSSVVRGAHAPSPLSLAQNNIVAVPPPVRSPPPRASTNPLPSTSSSPHVADSLAPGAGAQMARALSLDHAAATVALNANGIGRGSPAPQTQSPLSVLQESIALSSSPPPSPRSPGMFPKASPVLRHSRSAILSTSSRASEGLSSPRSGTASWSRPSVDTQRSDSTPPVVTSPTDGASETGSVLGLKITKRNRPHMPPLRLVTSKDSVSQNPRSPTLSVNTMITSTSDHLGEQETVQVQDMDFELVKPSIPASPFAGSVDSLPIPSPIRADGFLRADSPAMSSASGSSHRTPGDLSPSGLRSPKESNEVEAHRQREQRWITALSSVPASQARKSKKIRKLVLEGVPASVRYQVWATLTDSKGKRMEGLYQRLAQREKVPAFFDIERDIKLCFSEHPQLQDGSLAKLLQAYLCMVPDVQYSRGLALIVGQLLLQSPEEDAFWTFISLMDNHLRPYFSNTVQLEVDASLFAKALEANDAASAKKVFGDMAISPATVCRPWFMAVYADTLPSDYLLRVWDVFLFEGVTFLFRAGLAIFACSRRSVLQSTSSGSVLDALAHPPIHTLPPTPEAFIDLAFTVKLKDDDVRKQRNKLEAQVKRRTQPRASPLATTPTISLPKS
ncbi:hypothetical protein BN946_scf184674.g12 [Trametes cinnabarina]|uniref:Rab-GAP TBC domain-containing protein n=1 Tax=Pycnoporus cinnabarinus TaxID=5643 RepID=A0A060SVC1_PYCCI|nr:hypothetical protein BN946_scf184674.g12 [Trametes cinnabarina]